MLYTKKENLEEEIRLLLNQPVSFVRFPFAEPTLLDMFIEALDVSPYYQSMPTDRLKLLLLDKLGVSQLAEGITRVLRNETTPNVAFKLDRLVHKPALSSQFTPWHQDGAYWGEQQMLRIWIALDDFDEQSGCLKIYKQAVNKLEPHSPALIQDYFSKQIASIPSDTTNFITITAKKGDVILFNELAIHGSFPNISAHRRRAITGIVLFTDKSSY